MRTTAFHGFARATSAVTGRPVAFLTALLVVVGWAALGPYFHFSDTWQLVVNTGTTIVTFLMVFLIQNTQNRDTEAIQLKLDELIRVTQGAHLALLDLEELTDDDIRGLRREYARLASESREDLRRGLSDTGTPDVASLPGGTLPFHRGSAGGRAS